MSIPLVLMTLPEPFEQAKCGDFGEPSVGTHPPMNARMAVLPCNDAAKDTLGQQSASLRRVACDSAPIRLDNHGREVVLCEPLQFSLKAVAALPQRCEQVGQRLSLNCDPVFET